MSDRITSYSALVSAVIELAEDDSAEFAAYIPTAIDLAEQKLTLEADKEGLVLTTVVTLTAGTNEFPRPTDFRTFSYFEHEVDATVTTTVTTTNVSAVTTTESRRVPITKRPEDYLKVFWPVSASTAVTIKYWTHTDASTMRVAPTPAADALVRLKGRGRPAPISVANATNFWIDEHSNALFYATMIEMATFMRHYEVIPVFEKAYDRAIQGLDNEGRRERRDDAEAKNNPEGSGNRLVDGTH